MNTDGFVKSDQLYEMLLEVRKDTRLSTTTLEILVTKGSPPIMDIK